MKSPNKHIPKSVDFDVLTRQIPCSCHDVATYWTTPVKLRQWLSVVAHSSLESMAMEPECAGSFSFLWKTEKQERVELYGRFVSLDFPHHISFTCSIQIGPLAGNKPQEPNCLVEANFKDIKDEGCELTLTLRPLHETQNDSRLVAIWTDLMNGLPQVLETTKKVKATPQFPTSLGGFWTDLSDAKARIEGKRLLNFIDQPTADLLSHWVEHGFVILRSAATRTPMERFECEMENMWFRGRNDLRVAVQRNGVVEIEPLRPAHRQAWHKVLNVHGVSSAARDVLSSAPISLFLNHLFERPAKIYESGFYERGPTYNRRIDGAFHAPHSPMEFVGIQVVMGDKLKTSEIFHYCPQSHLGPAAIAKIIGHRRLEETSKDHDAWLKKNYPQETTTMSALVGKRGDIIIWHPRLVHGHALNGNNPSGRQTLIAHLCPVDVDPNYPDEGGNRPQAAVQRHKGQSYFSHPEI